MLLVHPLRSSARCFDSLRPILVDHGARVVDFDLPGHGSSSLGESSQSLESCAEVLATVCRAANINQPLLLGQGFGAYLCLHATRMGMVSPRAVLLWQPLLGPPSLGLQVLNDITGVAVDHLSTRTVESVWPTPTEDALHARAKMTNSLRTLREYAHILGSLEPLKLGDWQGSAPVHDLTMDRSSGASKTFAGLPEMLIQLGFLSEHDR